MQRLSLLSVILALSAGISPTFGQGQASTDPVARGFTQPSERRTFAFNSPGVVSDVLVREGDAVKVGQVLMKQEARMDEFELEIRRIDAESTIELDSASKEFDLRKVQYERKSRAGEGAYSPQEIEEAQITMELAELKIREAQQKQNQAKAVYERQRVKVDLMDITSLIDGIVEKINVDAGEMADPQKPEGAISVVKNDPLWVEVQMLETSKVARLKIGQELDVRYTIDPPDKWQKAKIIFISPVADARAGTQPIRLELSNPDNRASGLDVDVKLPAELAVEPTALNN